MDAFYVSKVRRRCTVVAAMVPYDSDEDDVVRAVFEYKKVLF